MIKPADLRIFQPTMQSLEADLSSYCKQYLARLPQEYTWHFDLTVAQQTLNLTVEGTNWYEKTRALKRELAARWSRSSAQDRLKIADYVVRVWGGVKRNAPETIASYVRTISDQQVPPTIKGIASWSKVAAFSNPAAHAIFDARVAFSLNALQVLQNQRDPHWFPKLAGRNRLLNRMWPIVQRRADLQSWKRIESHQVYPRYVELLNGVSQLINSDIDSIEMLLFSRAERLALEINALADIRT